jgi:hypothetical protein
LSIVVYGKVGAQVTRPIVQPIRFSYGAKFICGMQLGKFTQDDHADQVFGEPPVKRGNYATAINIHNPQFSRVKINKKVVLALPEPDQGKPTERVSHVLEPDGAMEVDCLEIYKLLNHQSQGGLDFLKGFLVIESTAELDVVGVYTANTDVGSTTNDKEASGMTMDIEYIPARRIISFQGPSLGTGDLGQ